MALLRAVREECTKFIDGTPKPASQQNKDLFEFRVGALQTIIGIYLAVLARAFEIEPEGQLREKPDLGLRAQSG
jgi:hypothetical protein